MAKSGFLGKRRETGSCRAGTLKRFKGEYKVSKRHSLQGKREEGTAGRGRERSLCTGPPGGAEIRGMERWGGLALGRRQPRQRQPVNKARALTWGQREGGKDTS